MARKPYNGFSVEDRRVSSRLFRLYLKLGRWERPSKDRCTICYLAAGPIEWHREDYSIIDPSGLVTICYRCHRVLHMRDKFPEAWDAYRGAIRRGYRWQIASHIGTVMRDNMYGRILPAGSPTNAPRARTLLDDIHEGLLLPDTPEIRRLRMDALYDEYDELRRRTDNSLFDVGTVPRIQDSDRPPLSA